MLPYVIVRGRTSRFTFSFVLAFSVERVCDGLVDILIYMSAFVTALLLFKLYVRVTIQ